MANNLVVTEANRLLDASLGVASYTPPVSPMKLALGTSVGTPTAAGAEVVGGAYSRQSIAFASSAAGASSNTGTVTYTNLPAATISAVEIYDSAGSPRRGWTGALSASKTVASGDSLSFAVGALALSLG